MIPTLSVSRQNWIKPPPFIDDLLSKLANLQVQEVEILRQLKQAHRIECEKKETANVVPDNSTPIFSVTSRVIVMNHVRVAKVKTVNHDNQQATVTTIKKYKVYFTTNNGTKTLRLSKNLSRP